jgi:pyruvate kinase
MKTTQHYLRPAVGRQSSVLRCLRDREFDLSQLHRKLPTHSACKLVCTVGPSSASGDVLRAMMAEGMSVCRLNFSHASHAEHQLRVDAIRQAASAQGVADTLAIALDTKGPEIRTGATTSPRKYSRGQRVRLVVGSSSGAADELAVDYKLLLDAAEPNQRILVADGMMELVIRSVDPSRRAADAEVVSADLTLSGRNNVHLPGRCIDLPALSDQDASDIAFGVAAGVDMVFASFARSAAHMRDMKKLLASLGAAHVPVIAKIENEEGIKNIDEIIAASDGVMVARGDLGVEIPVGDVFLVQKMMTAKSIVAAKPVICATQMLESMCGNSRPTRAEASDVANAVIDGVDSVMLSGETASGRFPVEALRTLKSIAIRANEHCARLLEFKEILNARSGQPVDFNESIAGSAILSAFELQAAAVVTTTISGNSVRRLAKYRPKCPIIAVCQSQRTARALSISRGVHPIVLPSSPSDWIGSFNELVTAGVDEARRRGILPHDRLLAVVTNTDTRSDADPFRCSMAIRWM